MGEEVAPVEMMVEVQQKREARQENISLQDLESYQRPSMMHSCICCISLGRGRNPYKNATEDYFATESFQTDQILRTTAYGSGFRAPEGKEEKKDKRKKGR